MPAVLKHFLRAGHSIISKPNLRLWSKFKYSIIKLMNKESGPYKFPNLYQNYSPKITHDIIKNKKLPLAIFKE